jgi:hypothetical protein
MRFHEFEKAEGSTLAVRQINRYADELGKQSMDYEVMKDAAKMLDKQMLKSLAQLLDDSDTAPREWIMKTIADHDPETFKKMYGDQEGYLSIMKPQKDLTDDEIEEGADFYGYYKDPKYPDQNYMTYPKDMEFKTPHRSNANARMFLSRIGLDPDFENTGSTPIDDFIAATDKYLRMNVSDKESEEYDEVEMYHIEANRIKKQHPEVTHVGFN